MKLYLFFLISVLLFGCTPLGQVTSYTSCEDITSSCIDSCQQIEDSLNQMACTNTCDEKATLCYCQTGQINDKNTCCWVGAYDTNDCCPHPGIKTGCNNI